MCKNRASAPQMYKLFFGKHEPKAMWLWTACPWLRHQFCPFTFPACHLKHVQREPIKHIFLLSIWNACRWDQPWPWNAHAGLQMFQFICIRTYIHTYMNHFAATDCLLLFCTFSLQARTRAENCRSAKLDFLSPPVWHVCTPGTLELSIFRSFKAMSFDIYPSLTADVVAHMVILKMAQKILPKRRPRPPSPPKCPWAERGINKPPPAVEVPDAFLLKLWCQFFIFVPDEV